MTRVLFFVALLAFGLISSCKKDDPEPVCPTGLPCATQEGANTFGCYIDGVPWVAKVEPSVLDPSAHPFEVNYDETGYYGFNDNYLRILANRYASNLQFFAFHFKPVLNIGKVDFMNFVYYKVAFRTDKNYLIDEYFPCEFNITKLDTVSNIVSGTFFFTAISDVDTINITDGRFDLKYYPE